MREIKFRAWHFGVMMYDDHVQPLLINRKDHLHHFFKYFSRDDDAIIMQYIGLQDKNGVEIYEGDIVKYDTTQESGIGKVETWQGGFVFTWIEQQTTSPSLFDNTMYFGCAAELEVIGNIYQNAALIERHVGAGHGD